MQVSALRVFAVVCAVICHLMIASSARFDFGSFLSSAEEEPPRDQRDNRAGPVLFPMTQPDSETSGVVIGASGFGFVPPGNKRPAQRPQNVFSFW